LDSRKLGTALHILLAWVPWLVLIGAVPHANGLPLFLAVIVFATVAYGVRTQGSFGGKPSDVERVASAEARRSEPARARPLVFQRPSSPRLAAGLTVAAGGLVLAGFAALASRGPLLDAYAFLLPAQCFLVNAFLYPLGGPYLVCASRRQVAYANDEGITAIWVRAEPGSVLECNPLYEGAGRCAQAVAVDHMLDGDDAAWDLYEAITEDPALSHGERAAELLRYAVLDYVLRGSAEATCLWETVVLDPDLTEEEETERLLRAAWPDPAPPRPERKWCSVEDIPLPAGTPPFLPGPWSRLLTAAPGYVLTTCAVAVLWGIVKNPPPGTGVPPGPSGLTFGGRVAILLAAGAVAWGAARTLCMAARAREALCRQVEAMDKEAE